MPRPACCGHPISKYFPRPFSTHLTSFDLGPKIAVLQTLEMAFPFDKMNNSQQQPLFCLVFTQLRYYFQRAFTGPAWNACPRRLSVCLGTQSAPTKGKEGQTFPGKIHTGLGTRTPGSWERFYTSVLPNEPSEISFLSRSKKPTFSKPGAEITLN